MKILKPIPFLMILTLFACKTNPLPTVTDVNVERYMGTWYEIASFQTTFQKGCECTKAEYKLSQDKSFIEVFNSCIKKGKPSNILGKAFPVEGSGNAKLKVQFFWPFKGDYYIIDLAPDYSYAMVGHPNRDYLWILCRNPVMEDSVFQKLVLKAKALGFDTSKLLLTVQKCDSIK